MKALIDAANQAQRTDPVPDRETSRATSRRAGTPSVPETLRYNPATNPKGARPTVFDAARNIYGVNPATGARCGPCDNVGVQYGLERAECRHDHIDAVPRSERKDRRLSIRIPTTPARTVGDADAIKRAYQAGLMLGANGGLTSIPILRQRHVERRPAAITTAGSTSRCANECVRPTAAAPRTW